MKSFYVFLLDVFLLFLSRFSYSLFSFSMFSSKPKANILKAKWRLDHDKRVSIRRLAAEIKISKTSAYRILLEDLGCFPYKKIKRPKLANLQKQKSMKFANWVLNNYAKNDTKRWLFTDAKFFFI